MAAKNNIAAVLYKAQDMRLELRPIPEPEDGEVLLRVGSVGICGSDVHYWWKGRTGRFVVESPIILGHETSATVVKCGRGVAHLKPGDRVAIEPGVPCRRCEHCKGGRYNVCPEVKFCATPPVSGTLTNFYVHAADFCFKLPDNVSDEEGALLEPLAVAVYSCRRAEVTVGTQVLILGAGPIGLVSLLAAKAMGASRVCITDINDNRLSFAKSLGADETVNVSGTSPQEAANKVLGRSGFRPTAIIECSGAESSYQLGILASAPRGVMVTVGRGNYDVTLPLVVGAAKEMDIRGIFRYANCYPAALAMVSSGLVDVKPLVTHRFSINEVLEAFHTAKGGAAIKVMIRVDPQE
ncbi:sorbitol dehydrogenase-like [Penaeus japonicus]|uniref:sorbitol dehydrogenase-like n=1 Tax=Penaeus japonicus TaxID=27405 RepID=UPI001C715159|nr:sorbitol dehydrogenase-like [Penaeus japonicus]